MQGINCKKKITGINHAYLQGQRMALLINGMDCGEYELCSKSKVLRKNIKQKQSKHGHIQNLEVELGAYHRGVRFLY